MANEHIQPDELFSSQQFGFSQVVASPPGKQIFVSGQVAWDKNFKIVGAGDLAAQAEQALKNLGHALGAAGATPADVTSLRVYIPNYKPEDASIVGRAVGGFFGDSPPSAQTLLGIQSLATQDLMIEIEATAVVS